MTEPVWQLDHKWSYKTLRGVCHNVCFLETAIQYSKIDIGLICFRIWMYRYSDTYEHGMSQFRNTGRDGAVQGTHPTQLCSLKLCKYFSITAFREYLKEWKSLHWFFHNCFILNVLHFFKLSAKFVLKRNDLPNDPLTDTLNSLTDTLLSAAEGAVDPVAKFTSLVRARD